MATQRLSIHLVNRLHWKATKSLFIISLLLQLLIPRFQINFNMDGEVFSTLASAVQHLIP